MNIAAPTAVTAPERAALAQAFNNLAIEMSNVDGKMERNANSGNTVAPEWSSRFQGLAAEMSHLRDQFDLVRPGDGALSSSLSNDVLSLSFLAGRLDTMVRAGHTYAGYWGTVMDAPIADAKAAATALFA